MKTLSVFILVSITFALTECRVLASEANDVNTLPRYELILGIQSGDCAVILFAKPLGIWGSEFERGEDFVP